MNIDWQDALSALRSSLPDGDSSAEAASTDSAADSSAGKSCAAKSAASGAATNAKGGKTLTLFYEKKGRAGKPATIIDGFLTPANTPEEADAEALSLASTLKQRLGCGGSARGGEILLQGDRREQLRTLLPKLGYKVKN